MALIADVIETAKIQGADQGVVDCLAGVLESGNDAERCLAVQALGRAGGQQASDLLITALRDGDPDVRIDAARAIAQAHVGEAIPTLLANLREDPVGEAKTEYVKTLRALGAVDATDLLCTLVVARGDNAGIDWEDDLSGWDDWLDVQREAVMALGDIAPPDKGAMAVSAIVESLQDIDGQTLWVEATGSLARLGASGLATLTDLAKGASPLNRKRIATALTAASDQGQALELAKQLAADPDATVRIAAIGTAATLGNTDVARAAMDDTAPQVRIAALQALGEADIPTLKKALGDIAPDVRIAACQAVVTSGAQHAGLGLIGRLERALRKGSAKLLAALVEAAAVAEPDRAGPVLEDITNHQATDPVVRCAALRALTGLRRAKTVDLLVEAAGDARQDVRLAAITGLAGLSAETTPLALRARAALAAAVAGELVKPPADWAPEEDTVLELPPRKGAQAAGEDRGNVLLDDEGNVVERDTPEAATAADEAVADEPAEADPGPTSTLGAILDFKPTAETVADDGPELDDADLEFLEMAGHRPGRRKVSPEAKVAAHLDVRRLAARTVGSLALQEHVEPLVLATDDRDEELCVAALDALAQLGDAGCELSSAEDALLRHAQARASGPKRKAIEALAHLPSDAAGGAIADALRNGSDAVRVVALKAAATRGDSDADFTELARDGARAVRLAAAEALAAKHDPAVVPDLLDVALAEEAVHKFAVVDLLAPFGGQEVDTALVSWVGGADRRRRLVALEMLGRRLAQAPQYAVT